MTDSFTPNQRVLSEKAVENITRSEELAYELRINEVMTRSVKKITPDMMMKDVVEVFRQAHISGAPVVLNDDLVGVLSLEDVIRCLVQGDIYSPVSMYMTTSVITVRESDPVIEALKIFVSTRLGRLPVLDEDNKLVGIMTKGDITRGMLAGLQKSYQEEEIRKYRARHLFEDIHSDRTSLILRYDIMPRDFNLGGSASSHIKRALLRLGASPLIARRCGIAIYEAEMNLIIHATRGGTIRVEIEPHQISIDAYDEGPGIDDVDQAMKPGYSTAPEEVRELGFGAGMGLTNINRCVDSMKLESIPGKGTRLKMKIFLQSEEKVGEGYPANKEAN
jgi:anti-sigma regulatory factor (Ser/Thr protein kinase)/predicted transcriptional regulator